MRERPNFHLTADKALAAAAARGVPVVPQQRQMNALAEAWKTNEMQKGSVTALSALQIEYCEMAGVPLRWS